MSLKTLTKRLTFWTSSQFKNLFLRETFALFPHKALHHFGHILNLPSVSRFEQPESLPILNQDFLSQLFKKQEINLWNVSLEISFYLGNPGFIGFCVTEIFQVHFNRIIDQERRVHFVTYGCLNIEISHDVQNDKQLFWQS